MLCRLKIALLLLFLGENWTANLQLANEKKLCMITSVRYVHVVDLTNREVKT
jgi:hypothetical protein